jgi:hypothetical protein
LIAIVLFAVAFPDTHGRELEEVSGDTLSMVGTPAGI